MKKEQTEKINSLELIFKSTKLCLEDSKSKIFMNAFFSSLASLTFAINIIMIEQFFTAITNLAADKSSYINALIVSLMYGGILVLNRFFNIYSNYYYDVAERDVKGKLYKKVNTKASKIALLSFENPKYLDDIKRANDGVVSCCTICSTLMDAISFYAIYEIFISIYLFNLSPWLALAMIFIIIPPILSQFLRVKFFNELADVQGPIKREYEYYEKCICDREYYKETRLLGAFSYFKSLYIKATKMLNKEVWKTNKKSLMADFLSDFLTILGYIAIIILSISLTIKGDINIAQFATVFGSIDVMIGMLTELVNYRLSKITKDIGFAKKLLNFLNIPEVGGEDFKFNDIPEINLENVSFSYPNSQTPSLNNINLKINAGETIAIVGGNGAGKSTLAKLIMGLYTPTKGQVYINGKNTTLISPKSIYENISAVFQNYQRYKMTLKDNIQISSISDENNMKQIEDATKKADFDVDEKTFNKGYDTMLSREFDGIDLSGGQWQRIAIARSFYKNHSMIVLDEPTAAIDPVMETKIYQKFAEMSKGNTSIVVTHRLGSAKIADRIIVMDKGEIAEIGTHDELMDNDSIYFNMYNAQSKWYVEQI